MKYIENILLFFLSLFLFGFLIEGFTFLKYIGLFGGIFFYIPYTIKNGFAIKEYFKNNKPLFIALILFIFSVILSIIFAYSFSFESIREFRIEFLNIGIFSFIVLNYRDFNKLKRVFLFVIIFSFIFNTLMYGYNYYIHNPKLNLSIRLQRNYKDYFVLLYPFVLGGFFIFKNRIKYLLFFILILGVFELILTGSRGGWVSASAETVIFFSFLILANRSHFGRKFLIASTLFFISIAYIGVFTYNHSILIKYAIKKGFSPNGRDKIVQTRLPIFIKNMDILTGIGGPGNFQYNKFLSDHHAPKRFYRNGRYYSDEPFLLQIFYKEGIIGLITYLFFSILLLWYGFRYIIYKKDILSLSLISSYIGFYFIHGIVEGRDIKHILFYFSLLLLFIKEDDENSIHLP